MAYGPSKRFPDRHLDGGWRVVTWYDPQTKCWCSQLKDAAVSTIERGTDPKLTNAHKLAKLFGCTIEEMWPSLIQK